MGFLDLDIFDFLDILLVTALLYQLYKLVKGTVAIKIFIGLASTYLFWKLVGALQMELLSEILGQFIGVGVLAIIIVFQQEIRKFLLMIGTTSFQNQQDFFKSIIKPKKKISINTKDIVLACISMSKTKTGPRRGGRAKSFIEGNPHGDLFRRQLRELPASVDPVRRDVEPGALDGHFAPRGQPRRPRFFFFSK